MVKLLAASFLVALCAAAAIAVPAVPNYFEADFELKNNMIPFPMSGHMWFDYDVQKQRMDQSMFGTSRIQIDDFKGKLSYVIMDNFGQLTCKACFLDQQVFPMTVPEICTKTGSETVRGIPCDIWSGNWAMTDMKFWVSQASVPTIQRAYFDAMGMLQLQFDFSNVVPVKPDVGVWQPNTTCSQPVCEVQLDLVLLVDGSGSIQANDFLLMKDFAAKIVNQFGLAEDKVKVSLIQFSSGASVQVPLSGDKNAVTNAIRNMVQFKSSTNMDAGLKATLDMLNGKGRFGAGKAVVMFTDGVPDSGTNPVAVAKQLKDAGISVYTVGVGSGVDPVLLKKIASEPAETYSFLADSFVKLQSLLNSLVQATCKGDTCTQGN